MLPQLKILIIEDSAELLEQLATSIRSTTELFDRPDIELTVVEADSVQNALEVVHNDGDIQAVVFSWDTEVKAFEIGESGNGKVQNNAVVIEAIKNIRPELPVYVLGDAIKGLDIVNQTTGMESFFYRNDIISGVDSWLYHQRF